MKQAKGSEINNLGFEVQRYDYAKLYIIVRVNFKPQLQAHRRKGFRSLRSFQPLRPSAALG